MFAHISVSLASMGWGHYKGTYVEEQLLIMLFVFYAIVPTYVNYVNNVHMHSFVQYERIVKPAVVLDFGS